jgi:hypothetical protein
LKDGDVTIPFLYSASNGEISGIGRSSSERLLTSNETANSGLVVYNYTLGHRYFVGSWNTSSDSESYLLRFTSFVNDNGINKTTVEKNTGSGWVEACGSDKKAGDTCTIGSLTLTLQQISPYPDRAVNFTGNGGSSFNTVYTNDGLKIVLPWFSSLNSTTSLGSNAGALNITDTTVGHNSSSFTIALDGEDRTDTIGGGQDFHINTTSNSDDEIELGNFYTGRPQFSDPDDNNHVMSRTYSDVSSLVERNGQSSDQRSFKVTYAGSDSFADVILTAKDATVESGGSTSSGGSVKILGSVSVSDSEASSVSSKNLIVVGGSCINSVAASLLGGALCGADFTSKTGVGAGSFLIQTFSRSGGTVATLVAGYNAPDTVNAAKYLISKPVDTTVGKKYKGTSATQADVVTETSTEAAA